MVTLSTCTYSHRVSAEDHQMPSTSWYNIEHHLFDIGAARYQCNSLDGLCLYDLDNRWSVFHQVDGLCVSNSKVCTLLLSSPY